MKKILHISKYYYPFVGGIEQTARDCVNSLIDSDVEQMVFCFNHEKGNSVDVIENTQIIRCGCFANIASQSLSLSYGKMLSKVVKEFKPDYIIFHYPNPFAAFWLLKHITPTMKLIVYWHLDIVKQKYLGKLFHFQNKKLISLAERIIATSPNYIQGSAYLKFEQEKCIVIPSCINEKRLEINDSILEMAKKIREEFSNKIICLAVGRHTEYKGFRYLVEACKYLNDEFQIFIAGKGELTNELKDLARGDEKIHFLGLVSDDELKAYLVAMDIFCFPSITRNEAFGLALAEALYFSKPAITFNIMGSGVNYVSINGKTGIEVENRNSKEFAKAINKLGKDSILRTEYGKNGKQRVTENFLYSSYRERIKDLINSLK